MENGNIKGTGDSRYLKSVADILSRYPDYESFAKALAEGTFPIDLNGINVDGWEKVGTRYAKETVLSDDAVSAIKGLGENPTPNDAFTALGNKFPVSIANGGTGGTTAESALYKLISGANNVSSSGLSIYDRLAMMQNSGGKGANVYIYDLLTLIANNISSYGSYKVPRVATGNYSGTEDRTAQVDTSIPVPFTPKVMIIVCFGTISGSTSMSNYYPTYAIWVGGNTICTLEGGGSWNYPIKSTNPFTFSSSLYNYNLWNNSSCTYTWAAFG